MTKRWLVIGLPLAAFVLVLGLVASAEEPAKGQQVFDAQKCNMCHSVSTAGIEAKSEKMFKGDLVNLAETRDAEWLAQYLTRKTQLEGEDHKKEFKGSDEELQALVDWLLEQKAEG